MDIARSIAVLFIIALVALLILYALGACDDSAITGGSQSKSVSRTHRELKDQFKDLNAYPASRFESLCRVKIERLTGKKFPCVLPAWLRYKDRQLELDGYNAELKLAFEAQGPQHTVFSGKYDPLYKKYLRRLENDRAKLEICEKNNVGLIIVDYIVPKHLLGSYIRSRIYDIATEWLKRGLHGQVNNLGILAEKAGDYVPIINSQSRQPI